MGAPSAQVQSSQTSQPASNGAGVSPSTPSGSGKGEQMSAMFGQPQMGQPNTNNNTGLDLVKSGFIPTTGYDDNNHMQIPGFGATTGYVNNDHMRPVGYTDNDHMQPKFSFTAPDDGITVGNPYPNTIGGTSNFANQLMHKGGGSSNNASKGKGA
jgi:hypothetical protein